MTKKMLYKKLNEYMELKNWIKEYNEEQLQKGLDLGGRIISDIVKTFPYAIGTISIDWWNNTKEELILRVNAPFDLNKSIGEEIVNYVIERYPDTEKHCSGIKLVECIPINRIDYYMRRLENKMEAKND